MIFVLLFILICPASAIWLKVKQILNHQTELHSNTEHCDVRIAIEVWFTVLCSPTV